MENKAAELVLKKSHANQSILSMMRISEKQDVKSTSR